jgi:hypothetical protein
LHDTQATTADVLRDVGLILPQLLPSVASIAGLMKRRNMGQYPPRAVPQFLRAFNNGPKVSARLDDVWRAQVDGEPRPLGKLVLQPSILVKPQGNMQDPIILLTSYASFDTLNPHFNTVTDPVSSCLNKMHLKFDEERPGRRNSGVTFMDLFPRRFEPGTSEVKNLLRLVKDKQIKALYAY